MSTPPVPFHRVHVSLLQRSYDIHIGRGLSLRTAEFLPFLPNDRAFFVLADKNVAATHADKVFRALQVSGARRVEMMAVEPGEGSKSLHMLERVLSWMLENGASRDSVLVAVGGGVVGDLGGFAASVMMRGISFVQVPTTLLAQVDSSVGGKTGINTKQGKNLVGAFHQPCAVVCDMETLETLPKREFLAGYAEIVKYGLIGDPEFFLWLEGNGKKICGGDEEAIARAVEIACRKKAEIVAADETEKTGARALLNLGHTFGHALEAAAGYSGGLLHGEAVSIGMVLAFNLSHRLGLCGEHDAVRVRAHLAAAGLPVTIREKASSIKGGADDIISLMKHDKKASGGKLVFVLVRGIGKAFISNDVAMDDVRRVVEQSMKGE